MRLVLFAATPSVAVRLPAELFVFKPMEGGSDAVETGPSMGD